MEINKRVDLYKDKLTEEHNESVRMSLHILCTLYLTNLFRSPQKNKNKIEKFITDCEYLWDELYLKYFSTLYQDNVSCTLSRNSLNSDYLSEVIRNLNKNLSTAELLTINEVIDSLELDIKNELINFFSTEYGCSENRISVIEKECDFIFFYAETMDDVIKCILSTNLENKKEMLEMTTESFARTLATYVDDCTKPLIVEMIKIGNLNIIKSLSSPNFKTEEFKLDIKTLSKKGIGDIESLLRKYFNHSPKKNKELYDKHKEGILILNQYIVSRNRIIHDFRPEKKHIDFIKNNWGNCLSFFSDILAEYTISEGFDNYFNELFIEVKECVKNDSMMVDNVFPLVNIYR